MIYLVEGVPGSGKTFYGMQKYLIPSFAKGKKIYTNIAGLKPLNICVLYNIDEANIDEINIYDTSNVEGIRGLFSYNTPSNSLIIIDELQNYYNSRDFKEPHARSVIDYLTNHRHYGHTIVGITQNIDSVDITFRRNASQVLRLTNMGYVGLQSKAKVHFFETSDTTKSPIATTVVSYDKRVFKCYDSVEPGAKVEHTKFIFPKKLIFVLFAAVLFVYAFNKLNKDTTQPKIKETKKIERQAKPEVNKPVEKKEDKLCFGADCKK